MEFKDYYQILGVSSDADAKEIKTAYRKMARKYHPDVNSEEDAEDKFKEGAEAYEVLKDKARRAEYDELRQYGGNKQQGGFTPPPDWPGGTQSGGFGGSRFEGDFSDFFSTMFGGGHGQARGNNPSGIKGQDLEIEMPVFLEDTLQDVSKQIDYHIPANDGTQTKKSIKVKIPKGVVDGQRIRLKGQGRPGRGDGVSGDLYLHIRLVPHPLFDVQGQNLSVTVPLAPWEVALGTKVAIPTLDGKISLTIPENSQSGAKLRIKGKGLPSKNGQGDLIAVLKIVMPATSDKDTKALWQKLAGTVSFDPRVEWGDKNEA